MAVSNRVRILRRPATSAPGAPSTTVILNAELAFNEADDILYYGKAVGSGDFAQTVIPIAGPGAFVDKTEAQTVGGVKTFTSSPIVPAPTNPTDAVNKAFVTTLVTNSANMLKSVYDTDNDGIVDAAAYADEVPYNGITGKPTYFPTETTSVAGLATALALKANLAAPTFTGNVNVPTPSLVSNNTLVATTEFVVGKIAEVVGFAPASLDTLAELAAALGNNPDSISAIITGLAGKLAKSANLADLTNNALARTNLGLGDLALQNRNNVLITGGTISNAYIDCGTW